MSTLNTYAQLEDDIVDRLSSLVAAGAEVMPLPDNEEDYSRAFEKPRITVAYQSSEYSPSTIVDLPVHHTSDIVAQDEFVTIVCFMECRALRGALGVHDLSLRVRRLLLGWMPTHYGRMYLKDHGFSESQKQNGVWGYTMTFLTKTMVVQEEDFDENILGTLTDVDFNFNPPTEILGAADQAVSTEDGKLIQIE